MNEQVATITAIPWGWYSGLFCASLTVLLGVAQDLDPDVILVRAVTAGTIAGVIVAFAKSLLLSLIVVFDRGKR
jgi:1-aminocyclopropane-1-carboxylate deaminase/D-cysteine desulfhydrase-like pyridoxal-dependent ACC family enzyme